MQLDLQAPMEIESVFFEGDELRVAQDGNAWFVVFPKMVQRGKKCEILVKFSGAPRPAENPPWDGGFSWETDANGNPFVATSCQGDGASLWWPCKDHMYDEPDSMMISICSPPGLTAVGNGRLRAVDTDKDGWNTFHWFVENPINNTE